MAWGQSSEPFPPPRVNGQRPKLQGLAPGRSDLRAGLRAKVSPGPPSTGGSWLGPGHQSVLGTAVPGSCGSWAGEGPGLRPIPQSSCYTWELVRNAEYDLLPENLHSTWAPGMLGWARPPLRDLAVSKRPPCPKPPLTRTATAWGGGWCPTIDTVRDRCDLFVHLYSSLHGEGPLLGMGLTGSQTRALMPASWAAEGAAGAGGGRAPASGLHRARLLGNPAIKTAELQLPGKWDLHNLKSEENL